MLRNAVQHSTEPTYARQRPTLRVGDRHDGNVREQIIDLRKLLKVEPTVQGGDKGGRLPAEQRKWEVVDVKVQNVELIGSPVDQFQHPCIGRHPVPYARIEPDRLRPHRLELRRSNQSSAGEQGHVVTHTDQFFGEISDHPLGSAVQLRGNRFKQRRNLSDAHDERPPRCPDGIRCYETPLAQER